ncbi:hypothetical protein [Agrobacterium larrymoorei]|uniref:Uncharacterized protein n=1 Tax=Agrobacterium larrymoorei TaxID=160699 RepID=A0AAF0H9Y5_9HYPH|nr:hypothetical protein [Agrobacterium larrymoorei]WHA40416.1 hypothetical protein CFBP5477_011320 [Agrobacterium larrymoorei]
MKVLDDEPWGWHLLEDGDTLYLDAHCSHSFIDYSVIIALNEAERAAYQAEGRTYLNKLAHEIHYSAPGVIGSQSRFRSRNLMVSDKSTAEKVFNAIMASANSASPSS